MKVWFSKKYIERFWSKVNKTKGCWLWTDCLDRDGYGIYFDSQKKFFAHRYSILITLGGIPTDLVVDHLCRTRKCVRPQHLRLVTRKINNTENSLSQSAINKSKTHCINGHSLSGSNVNVRPTSNGGTRRFCRECRRLSAARYKARAKRVTK